MTRITNRAVTGVTVRTVIDVTLHPVTGGTAGWDVFAEDCVTKERESEPNRAKGEEVKKMAEKKVAPKAPAAKSSSTSGKAAATRVTKKKVLRKLKKQ